MQRQILTLQLRGFDGRTSLCWYLDTTVEKKKHIRADDDDNLITDMLFQRPITLCL